MVQVLTLTDGGDVPIGAKRQALLRQANAQWVSFVDDDDLVAHDYVRRILSVIRSPDPPDVIGFRVWYFESGVLAGQAISSYRAKDIPSLDSRAWVQRQERQPNHLNPVRRELALRVGYRAMNFGEDADYAERLAVLKPREVFLDWTAYEYLFVSHEKRPAEVTNHSRYGR